VHNAIETSGLIKTFGTTRALDGVDLRIREGSVIRILATLLRPDARRATVLGHDVVREARAVRQKVSLTEQYASVDEDLTGTPSRSRPGRARATWPGPRHRRSMRPRSPLHKR
jgi:ABC-2 type transport system ATP-binding protein